MYNYFNKELEKEIQDRVSHFNDMSAEEYDFIYDCIFEYASEHTEYQIQKLINKLIDAQWSLDLNDNFNEVCYISTIKDLLKEALHCDCYSDWKGDAYYEYYGC